jgi:outer membrane protein assembly factor BamB
LIAALVALVVICLAGGVFAITGRDDGGASGRVEKRAGNDAPFRCLARATPDPRRNVAPKPTFRAALGEKVVARPYVAGNVVVIATEKGHVVALDAERAKVRWSANVGAKVVSDLAGDDEVVVVADQAGHLRAFALAGKTNGARAAKWDVDLGEPLGTPRRTVDAVYVGGARGGIFGVDIANGKRRFHIDTDRAVFGRPYEVGAFVYAANTGGRVFKVSTRSGEIEQQVRVPGGVEAGISSVGKTIVVATTSGRVVALDPRTLKRTWMARIAGEPAVYATLERGDDRIYVGASDCALHAFDGDGKRLWRYAARGSIDTKPERAGALFVGSDDGTFASVARDGDLQWRRQLGSPPTAAFYDHERVWVVAEDGTLFAFPPR